YNVTGCNDYCDTTLDTGTAANDTVNVLATGDGLTGVPGSFTVRGHAVQTVNVGNAGSVQGIALPLTVDNPESYAALTPHASADTAARRAPRSGTGLSGLADGAIKFPSSTPVLSALPVKGGSGGNTFTVAGTPPLQTGGETTLDVGSGPAADTVTVMGSVG